MELNRFITNSSAVDIRNTYFYLELPIADLDDTIYMDKLNDSVDMILGAMGTKEKPYKVFDKSGQRLFFYFKTGSQKRKGQLNKFCTRYLPEDQIYNAKGITKEEIQGKVYQMQKNKNYMIQEEPDRTTNYDGKDIQIFSDPTQWYPWQKQVHQLIYNEDGTFKDPHPRHIINIVDKAGNSGKSTFFKYLSYKYQTQVGRIGYGTSSQLRSSLTNLGEKTFYIIDLARSKSKTEKEEDLLGAIEDLKSGVIINPMFGSGKVLYMNPPHIVISSNYTFNYKLLSNDRWQVYEIKADKKLGRLNELVRNQGIQESLEKLE